MRIALVAEEAAGVQALRTLMAGPDEVVAVLTSQPSASEKRGVAVADLACDIGCAVWSAEEVTHPALARRLRNQDVDLLLNVHSLHMIHKDVLAVPSIGSFNLHPGPLPAYAGLNAPSWAIYLGESRHAATVHWMQSGIDTGPIAYEAWFDLDEQSTGFKVSANCARQGISLIRRLLNDARCDPQSIPAVPQDLSRRRLFSRNQIPHGGRVPWTESAEKIVRFIRASDFYPLPSPWGHPLTFLHEQPIRLVKAASASKSVDENPGTVVDIQGGEVRIATGAGIVVVRRVLIDGKLVDATSVIEPGMSLR